MSSALSYRIVLSEAFFSVVMPFPISPWIDASAEICILHSSRSAPGRAEPSYGTKSVPSNRRRAVEHSLQPRERFPKTASTHQALGL